MTIKNNFETKLIEKETKIGTLKMEIIEKESQMEQLALQNKEIRAEL
jgi:hypothetical protein